MGIISFRIGKLDKHSYEIIRRNKKEMYEYIERIEDDQSLWILHEEILEYLKKGNLEIEKE